MLVKVVSQKEAEETGFKLSNVNYCTKRVLYDSVLSVNNYFVNGTARLHKQRSGARICIGQFSVYFMLRMRVSVSTCGMYSPISRAFCYNKIFIYSIVQDQL